jgi:glycosyltransferase domain-containing protein
MIDKKNQNKLTIIIATYNRQSEVLKKIEFWKKYNFNIIIIDGSKKKFKFKFKSKNGNIRHYHKDEFQYNKRIIHIANKIKTKYVKLESDDDYFLPSTLIKSINFLEKEKSFSAVFGKCGIYSSFKNKVYINTIFSHHKSIIDSSSADRLRKFFSNYSPALYYSVMRKEVFLKNIKVLKSSIFHYGSEYEKFAEIHLPISICLNGKIKVLNDMFWIRKDDDIKNRIPFKTIKKIEADPGDYSQMFKDFYKKIKTNYFKKFFTNLIKYNKKKISSSISLEELKSIIDEYYKNCYHKAIQKEKYTYFDIMKKLIFFIIPSDLKKFIRFSLGINGLNINEIVIYKNRLNYNFKDKDMKNLKKFLIY